MWFVRPTVAAPARRPGTLPATRSLQMLAPRSRGTLSGRVLHAVTGVAPDFKSARRSRSVGSIILVRRTRRSIHGGSDGSDGLFWENRFTSMRYRHAPSTPQCMARAGRVVSQVGVPEGQPSAGPERDGPPTSRSMPVAHSLTVPVRAHSGLLSAIRPSMTDRSAPRLCRSRIAEMAGGMIAELGPALFLVDLGQTPKRLGLATSLRTLVDGTAIVPGHANRPT